MNVLTEEAITVELATVPGWAQAGHSITRTVQRADFRAAMLYVGAVAYLAEEANHHPDILVHGWNHVRLVLYTHSQGGITQADLDMARKLDGLV